MAFEVSRNGASVVQLDPVTTCCLPFLNASAAATTRAGTAPAYSAVGRWGEGVGRGDARFRGGGGDQDRGVGQRRLVDQNQGALVCVELEGSH